jgi:hypothetical protein
MRKVQMSEQARPPVFIHVGAPKSGTTFLQRMLWHNRDALRRDGFFYPGDHFYSHVWATFDLRETTFKGHRDPKSFGAWKRMVDQIREFGGPAIIDQELLSGAFPHQIGRAKHDLSFADVHIVYTLRDMARTLPAAWQEWVKNRETDDFAGFLAAIHQPPGERSRTGQLFWNLHDAELILSKWGRQLPPENVHVITLPPPGSDPQILWNRFAGLLGLDPTRYSDTDEGSNSSLAAPEATVLRRLNVAIGGDEFPWPVYDRMMKHYLAPELARRRGPAIALPHREYEWAVTWCQDTAKFIADAGYDVIGDLSELMPTAPRNGVDPDEADPAAQADAAVAGMAALVSYISRGGDPDNPQRITELETRLDRAERALRAHRELSPGERIKRCFVELSGQVRWMQAMYRVYRKLLRRPAPGA